MRVLLIILICLCCKREVLRCQELPANVEQQLEESLNEAAEEEEPANDEYLQELDHYKRHPLNINTAEKGDLRLLSILNEWQIENLISYRKLLGRLISLYELQAVPGWDLPTIRKLWQYLSVNDPVSLSDVFTERLKKGEAGLLFRVSQVLEKAAGFTKKSTGNHYLGSPQQVFIRYRYKYKDLLQYGITAEKDAGEPFFNEKLKSGFDFYSLHLFIRRVGIIESLALGDFTVNLGQGLIHWQSMAFKMGASVLNIKRESPVLKPYGSAGEFNFLRGIGLTLRKGKWEGTGFISFRKLSGTVTDGQEYFSSLQTSGYHRTDSELKDRNNIGQVTTGGNIRFTDERFRVGVNGIYHRFSLPLQKKDEPYNLFAVEGKEWYNGSIDYAYTGKNFHVFGEMAIDRKRHTAVLNGIMMSVDRRVDIALLHRAIAKEYQSVNGNAFTENTLPSNENGLYTGISIHPTARWSLNAWVDTYQFPWLRFGVDYPSQGRSCLLQVSFMPDKKTELNITYRNREEEMIKRSLRFHMAYSISEMFTLRNRYELTWVEPADSKKEEGFLTYVDLICKPVLKPFSIILRWLHFETSSYASRIYAYENDVLFSYAVPAYSGRGNHYGILISYKIAKWLNGWLHFQQTVYPGLSSLGSGLSQITGNRKTELKIQLMFRR
jgi:hypothetical protein